MVFPEIVLYEEPSLHIALRHDPIILFPEIMLFPEFSPRKMPQGIGSKPSLGYVMLFLEIVLQFENKSIHMPAMPFVVMLFRDMVL